MKALVTGKNSQNIKPLLKSLGIEVVSYNPEVIISYGGDGTLLYSERTYPGIPKLPIRNSLICKKCPRHDETLLLQKLLKSKLKLKEYKKLETTFFYKTFYALNDFVIRNKHPIHTIRFKIPPSDKLILGDGIVISTSFGSTGYFKSITRQTFDKGFGVAFNNTIEKIGPLLLKDRNQVVFKLVRGQATLSFDNNPDIFNIDEGSELIFQLSDKIAKIYETDSLRCPDCIVRRDV
ncbi:hypothetical protein HYU93_04325 [Candidatus Daviesbacteria bacterium]|nr:hypothetical protein [Candidatus Daviesbacteria bacterium]